MITTNQSNTFAASPLRHVLCFLFLVSAAVATLAALASSTLNSQDSADRVSRPCGPVTLLNENFDSVTPPALPVGWSSITWVTSNSGVPTPPADSLPNAAFVDDPATIS